MKFKKHLVLIVGGAVTLLLAAAISFFLSRYIGRYRSVMSNLDGEVQTLNTLTHKEHFPSAENVEQAKKNLEVMRGNFDNIFKAMALDTYEPPKLERPQVPVLLANTLQNLNQLAVTNNCLLPQEKFMFGYDRYAKALPEEKDIPRLARQLYYIRNLCTVLFENKISKIVAVERELFELGTDGAGATAGMGMMAPAGLPGGGMDMGGMPGDEMSQDTYIDPSGLFLQEKFVLTFVATEPHLYEILNALARHPLFCIVTKVELENRNPVAGIRKGGEGIGDMPMNFGPGTAPPASIGPGFAPPSTGGGLEYDMGGPGGTPDVLAMMDMAGQGVTSTNQIPAHDLRVLAGRNEPITVKLYITIYHFMNPDEQKGNEESPS